MDEDQNDSKLAASGLVDPDGEKANLWEYGLLLVLIAIVVIVALIYLPPVEQPLLY